VGIASVDAASGIEDVSVGVVAGVVSAPHPLTKIAISKTNINKTEFRRFSSILLVIFSFLSFSRIVLDKGY